MLTTSSQKNFRKKLTAGLSLTAALTLPFLITGCGEGNTSLATDDQTPDPVVLDIPIAYIQVPSVNAEDEKPARRSRSR